MDGSSSLSFVFAGFASRKLTIHKSRRYLLRREYERKFMNSSLVSPNLVSRCSSTKVIDAKSGSVHRGFLASVVGGGVGVDTKGGGVKSDEQEEIAARYFCLLCNSRLSHEHHQQLVLSSLQIFTPL
ncbi:hypothetical protein Tco_0622986 [Tanacetum coccineum]